MAVKRILRYVKAVASHGLFFTQTSNNLLHEYSDSDRWVGGGGEGETWMIKNPPLVLLYSLVIT